MLTYEQAAELAGALCATAETLGQSLSASAAELMAQDLAEYSEDQIAGALQACRRELTGKLTLAAILQRINAADGRPGRDEAWAIALQGSDERETVVMTAEIQKALIAATPILRLGDKVGARMAFLSAYDRYCAEARNQGAPVKWEVSLGFDPDRRRTAIEDAQRQGLLPPADAARELARLEYTLPPSDTGAAIAGLITGNSAVVLDPEARGKLAAIKEGLVRSQQEKAERNRQQLLAERKRIDESRADALAALNRLEQGKRA